MTIEHLRGYETAVVAEAGIDSALPFYRGKVRDCYDISVDRRLLITTDRMSAFDKSLALVPFKGEVLNRISKFWFEMTSDICDNHILEFPDPNATLARRVDIIPIEMVVRGYLAGNTSTSILTRYAAGERNLYGHQFKNGMLANQALPHPIITPTTKAPAGAHDTPMTEDEVLRSGAVTRPQWEKMAELALRLFERGQKISAERGLILVDTKYEFGIDADGSIVLADEVHTPDSSRFWVAQSYEQAIADGHTPKSLDKDVIRNWVLEKCNPYRESIPQVPTDVIARTSLAYIRAFEVIIGDSFDLPPQPFDPGARLRANIASFIRKSNVTTA